MSSTNLARRCVRLLDVRPDATVTVATHDGALAESVTSLLGAAGAILAGDDAGVATVDAALVELDGPLSHSVPLHAQEAIGRVRSGGRVVIVLRDPSGETHPNLLAQHMAPMLDMATAAVEDADAPGVVLLAGARRKQLSRDRIKELRGLAHSLDATVLVGRAGLEAGVIAAAREAVERHGLIKVKLTAQSDLDKHVAARDVAWATGSQLVQRIGKVAVIFRPDAKLHPPGQPVASTGRAKAKPPRPSQRKSMKNRKTSARGGQKRSTRKS